MSCEGKKKKKRNTLHSAFTLLLMTSLICRLFYLWYTHLLTFFLSCGNGYSTLHISSKRDRLSRTCSGKGVLYVSMKSLGRAWTHRPWLYLKRSSFNLSRTSADTAAEDFEGGEVAGLEDGENVTFKSGKMAGSILMVEANPGGPVAAG